MTKIGQSAIGHRAIVMTVSFLTVATGVSVISNTAPFVQGAQGAASAWLPVSSTSTTAMRATAPRLAKLVSAGPSAFVQPLTVPLGLGSDDGVDGMAVADLNGDGTPDLALVEHKAGSGGSEVTYLATLFGNGDLSFQTPTLIQLADGGKPITLTGAAQVPIVVGDLRADKRHDIIVAVPGRSELLVYLDKGAGTYPGLPAAVTLPGPAVQLAVADLGNGHADVVALLATTPPEVITLMGNGSGSFPNSAVSTFKSGLTPNDLAVVPLTASGKPDIVVSGYDGGNEGDDTNIGILLNKGSGTFPSAATLIDSGLDALGFEIGNFSGSGHVDILAAGGSCNAGTGPAYCQILLPGNGDGTFGAPTTAETLALASNPSRGATPNVRLDLDGDGNSDAIWVHGGASGSPTMLTAAYGDGKGGFTTREWVGTGTANTDAMGVIAADLTGSGAMDLVVDGNAATGGFTSVTGGVYIIPPASAKSRTYESSAVLEPGANFLGNTPTTATGDFSGSGHLDIATTSVGPAAINLLPGNGAGAFGPETSTTEPSLSADLGPVSADFDGDGHPDLGWGNGTGISFAIGNGHGGFGSPATASGGGTPNAISARDVNGDGHPDLVVEYQNENGEFLQSFLWDPAKATFDPQAPSAAFPYVPQGNQGPAFGVFTATGHTDVALVTTLSGNPTPQVVVFPGDGSGGFDVAAPIDVAPECGASDGPVVAGDMNGDGHDDLVWQCGGKIHVALGNGDGTFSAPTSYADPWVFESSATASGLVLAHIFSTGRLDVAEVGTSPAGGPGGAVVFPGNGDGTLGTPLSYAAGNNAVSTVTAAPLAGGGLDDLVVGQWGNSGHYGGLITVLVSTGGAELTASAVTAPGGAVTPGQPVTTSWTVTNSGTRPASGTWSDSVYLGTTPAFSSTDELVGSVSHTGDLAPGQSYRSTLPPTTLPGIPAGSRYLIVVPDSGGLFSAAAKGVATSAAFTVNPVPVLAIGGAPTTGTIDPGEVLYFQVSPAVDKALVLSGTFGAANTARFAERSGAFPNPSTGSADETYPTPSDRDQTLSVPNPQGGTYYVMLVGLASAAGGQTYSMRASQPTLAVTGFSPASFVGSRQSGDSNPCALPGDPVCNGTSLTVTGSGFTAATKITLLSRTSATRVAATSVTFVDPNTVVAAFPPVADFPAPGLEPGTYTVQASIGASDASALAPFGIDPTNPPQCYAAGAAPRNTGDLGCGIFVPPVSVSLSTAPVFRPPAPGAVTVSWMNLSGSDQPAPVIEIVGTDVNFDDPQTGLPSGQSETEVLGVGSGARAGVLAPGERGSITLTFTQPTVGVSTVTGFIVDPAAKVDWPTALSTLRPASISSAAWSLISANFAVAAGPTLGSYEELLDDAATYLSGIGEQPTGDANQEFGLALETADGFGTISARFTTGAMGVGQEDPTDLGLTINAAGDVVIHAGGDEEVFVPEPGGSYASPPGDSSTMTKQNDGSFRLRSPDGSVSAWAGDGRFEQTSDRNGNLTVASYDGKGRLVSLTGPTGLVSTYSYDAAGRIVAITPPSGRTTTFTYDSSGRVATSTLAGSTTTYAYEPATAPPADQNAVTSITDPTGVKTTFTYLADGRLASAGIGAQVLRFAYGAFGQASVTSPDGATTTAYLDTAGRQAAWVDALGRRTSTSFDALGRVIGVTRPGGLSTTYTYDQSGNVASVTDPAGRTTGYTYDAASDLSSVTDPDGQVTSYTRDAHGDVTKVQSADGTSSLASYNANGTVATSTDAGGRTTTFGYDAHQRLTSATLYDGVTHTFSYDAEGDLASVADPTGTVAYSYDPSGTLASVGYPGGRSLTYSYDADGRVLSTTDQGGYALDDTYDAFGQLSKVTDSTGATILTDTYDSSGRLTGEARGNGTSVAYTWDAAGEPTGVTNKSPTGATTSAYSVAYTPAGLPSSLTTPAGVETLGFDAAGELTSVALPGGRSISYAYDADGNRTSVTDGGVTTPYTVGSMGQYTSVGPVSYSYDADGRLIGATGPGGTSTWTYDDLGQLAGVTTPAGAASYSYDAAGDQISATRAGVTTEYLPDPLTDGLPEGTYDGTGTLLAHDLTRATTLVGSKTAGGSASFYSTDTNQDVVAVTDPTGAITGTASYLPFGETLASSGSMGTVGFAGSVGTSGEPTGQDVIGGFRPYDPALGRFMTRDILAPPGGNSYSYALNDPVQLLDRNGLDPTDEPSGNDLASSVATAASWLAGQVSTLGQAAEGEARAAASVIDSLVAGTQELNAWGGSQMALEWNTFSLLPKGVVPPSQALVELSVDQLAQQGRAINAGLNSALTTTGVTTILGPLLAGVAVIADIVTPIVNSGSAYSGTYWVQAGGLGSADVASIWFPPAGLVAHFTDYVSKTTAPVITEWWDSGEQYGGRWILHKIGSWLPFGSANSKNVNDHDPNDIHGPAGFGPAHWLAGTATMPFTIEFANQAKATAPVQAMSVTETLDPHVDASSFAFGPVGFVHTTVIPPARQDTWSTTVPDTASVSVRITGAFDPSSRKVVWTLTAVDPATGAKVSDPLVGFLAPDVKPPEGEGYVSYSVSPEVRVPTPTRITTKASVVFDQNKAIPTATLTNAIDGEPPEATLGALPATTPAGELTVSWKGTDGPGSGVASYQVYVSVDHKPLAAVGGRTTKTSVAYKTTTGHSYGFAVVATDNVGNGGGVPRAATVSTTAVPPPSVSRLSPATGLPLGGTLVTIIGSNLSRVTAVHFGSALARIDKAVSATKLEVTSPKGSGTVDVTLTADGVTSPKTAADHYSYVLPPQGYYLAGRNGTVLAVGGVPALAGFSAPAPDPVTGITTTPDGRGWFAVTADGLVTARGDATYRGDLLHPPNGGKAIHASDIVDIVATTDGGGYWLLGADGEVYPFGDAGFHGDLLHLPGGKSVHVTNIVGMVAAPAGSGYLLIGSDGGVFALGAVRFYGSLPGIGVKVDDIRAILPAPGDTGYVLVGADGGAFVFGHGAPFKGSLPGEHIHVTDIVGLALTPDGQGYWMAGSNGAAYSFGDAKKFPSPAGLSKALPIAAIGGT